MSGASQRSTDDSAAEQPAQIDGPQRTISGFRLRVDPPEAPPSERSLRNHCLTNVVVHVEDGSGAGAARALEVEFPYDTHFFAGLEGDLHCGGLFVATYHVLPPGTLVRLAFDLPGGAHVDARGRVKWVRDQDGLTTRRGLAVEFVDVDVDAVRHIAEFCAVRPPFFFDLD